MRWNERSAPHRRIFYFIFCRDLTFSPFFVFAPFFISRKHRIYYIACSYCAGARHSARLTLGRRDHVAQARHVFAIVAQQSVDKCLICPSELLRNITVSLPPPYISSWAATLLSSLFCVRRVQLEPIFMVVFFPC